MFVILEYYYYFYISFFDYTNHSNRQSVSFVGKRSRVKTASFISIPAQRLWCCHREVVYRLFNKNTSGILKNPILISLNFTALPPWDNVSLTDLVVRNHSVDEAGSQIWQRPDQHWSLLAGGHKGTAGRRGVYNVHSTTWGSSDRLESALRYWYHLNIFSLIGYKTSTLLKRMYILGKCCLFLIAHCLVFLT